MQGVNDGDRKDSPSSPERFEKLPVIGQSVAVPAAHGRPTSPLTLLFVYGTLLPGDVRWPLLRPFVVDDGWPDRVPGRLYDTGEDFPAAVFDDRTITADDGPTSSAGEIGDGVVLGRTFALVEASLARCLEILDEEEGTVGGWYRRIVVRTAAGVDAWAYEYGSGLDLSPITNGDWRTVERP